MKFGRNVLGNVEIGNKLRQSINRLWWNAIYVCNLNLLVKHTHKFH